MGQIELDSYCRNVSYIQDKYHKVSLDVRKINKIIQSDNFKSAWELATGGERWLLLSHLKLINVEKVKKWINDYEPD